MEGMNRREPHSAENAFGTDADATIRAAWLYYHHDLTQAEIAKQLQVSRPTVANLLARARNRGMVRISLRPDLLGRRSLQSLAVKTKLPHCLERFGRDALMFSSPMNEQAVRCLRSIVLPGRNPLLWLLPKTPDAAYRRSW